MSTPTEERSDLLIRNIWKQQTDVRTMKLDAPTNIHRKPEAVLFPMSVKRRNSSKPAWTKSSFVCLCDGVLGNEVASFEQSKLLSPK